LVSHAHLELTQNRNNYISDILREHELKESNLYRLTNDRGIVNSEVIPFRFALNDLLNTLISIKNLNESDFKMSEQLIRASPILPQNFR
jgi:hypothetical protein